jgi:hypothetical protein
MREVSTPCSVLILSHAQVGVCERISHGIGSDRLDYHSLRSSEPRLLEISEKLPATKKSVNTN